MLEARIVAIVAALDADEGEITAHAANQMLARGITVETLLAALHRSPEVIEDYADEGRGSACLIRCLAVADRVLHIVVSFPPFPVIITAYWPDREPRRWDAAFRTRITP